ncbi:PI-PLC X domain-containing protein 1 [Podospora aff. communis PSN243]|uniref:PI-PLC X domain-containing protein 1 n=1 Tax=Podospora aff. communis PSN243 TaxID=3040156 RepID=A0AAV9GUL7_9PEZI|nr:PI-PLC X domain-containing protein 1 [Podospora aff. communis PSN243]
MGSLERFSVFLALLALGINTAHGQTAPSISTNDPALTILTGTKAPNAATTTGTYQTFSSTITLATTALTGTGTVADNATSSSSSSSDTVTFLTGSATTTSGNATTTSTVAAPVPTNTRPCNNYPEFCDRKYSNITEVGAHNSPFVRQGSAAANQQLDVIDQLNDGIRFLQAQIQWPTNGTVPHFCHSTCDLLDAGPITDWLGKVKDWVAGHPYDVVTILLGNGNYSKPELYVPFIESTGILQYVYTPPLMPMSLEDWPTLAQMILTGQRVVMFLDYDTNHTAYPWLIDQFSNMWETPFDPVDREFPCEVQRPPDLKPEDAKRRLYMMNHNLNVEVSLLGASILVPAVSELNITNNATGKGSVGASAENCRAQWGNPPTVLNVDYYNIGGYPGSVFEAAAMMNNVTYNRPCCGVAGSAAARVEMMAPLLSLGLAWLVMSLVL